MMDAFEMINYYADRGRIIEAGFQALRVTVMPKDASPVQVEEMRMAFFAGAQHLFGSIMQMLDPVSEPTDKDIRRMTLINAELEEFIKKFQAIHGIPQSLRK